MCEGGGGKPARAEAAGDAAAKKRACKLFLPLCVPTANARGLGTVDRPRAQRGGTPKRKIKLFLIATFLIRDLFQRKILFLHNFLNFIRDSKYYIIYEKNRTFWGRSSRKNTCKMHY
ncbi:MAG TPA: hypothetical protein GXZ40_07310 [Bacteroidales bacterium]|nr:hypothetical protein [Bacteroidales bacterium]